MTPEVKEFMAQLGFVKGKFYYTHKDTELDISEDEATFFYHQFRLRELRAKKSENQYHIQDIDAEIVPEIVLALSPIRQLFVERIEELDNQIALLRKEL